MSLSDESEFIKMAKVKFPVICRDFYQSDFAVFIGQNIDLIRWFC